MTFERTFGSIEWMAECKFTTDKASAVICVDEIVVAAGASAICFALGI